LRTTRTNAGLVSSSGTLPTTARGNCAQWRGGGISKPAHRAHTRHAQIARRANLPHGYALAPSGKSRRCSRASRLGKRGVSRSVTKREAGCGGRGSVARERNRRAALAVSDQSAQDEHVAAYGKTVWSWHPLLVLSFAEARVPDRVQLSLPIREATEARRIRLRGERGIRRQTIAQGRPGCIRLRLWFSSCAFLHYLAHRGPRVPAGTRSSLRPLDKRGSKTMDNSGAMAPREGGLMSRETCATPSTVIARHRVARMRAR
jgi:hypothetical protein